MSKTYTIEQAKSNATSYKGYLIGTMSLVGDSRYITVLFDKDYNVIYECVCDKEDMRDYVDYLDKEMENE